MAKYYVLNTAIRAKRPTGSFTIAGRFVPANTRFPLEESQLEDEYDHLKSLAKDGVIQIRETATGQVFSFPEKAEVVPEPVPAPKPELAIREEKANLPPDTEDDSDLADVVPLPRHEPPKPMAPPVVDSAAEAPLKDLLDMVKEEPKPVDEPKSTEPTKSKKGSRKSKKG